MSNNDSLSGDARVLSDDDVKHHIRRALPMTLRELVIFSDTENDLDVAIVVGDDKSKVRVIETLSDLLVRLSIAIGRLITVTPLHESEYVKRRRAFVLNVAKAAERGLP